MTAPHRWSDEPITSAAQDEFARAGYARRAAGLIDGSWSSDTSTVFGLTGPWGSGKTSLIEMIVEELPTGQQGWHVARFTPWASTDVAGLLSEFCASLAEALPKDRRKAVKKSLATLLRIAAPAAALVPVAGSSAAKAAEATSEALTRAVPWQVAFEDAAEKLRETGKRLLIIADDIDRLQADELMALLKVVRLLGRFPGTRYLLAYDDQTLARTLSTAWGVEDDGEAAGKFMEKIVQYPLVVPPLLDHQLVERLETGIDTVLHEAGRPPMEARRLSNVRDILPALLLTPRAIDRLLAQLRYYLVLLDPAEIDDEDVILLSIVRTSFPQVYDSLPRWRSRLLTGHSGEIGWKTVLSGKNPPSGVRCSRACPIRSGPVPSGCSALSSPGCSRRVSAPERREVGASATRSTSTGTSP